MRKIAPKTSFLIFEKFWIDLTRCGDLEKKQQLPEYSQKHENKSNQALARITRPHLANDTFVETFPDLDTQNDYQNFATNILSPCPPHSRDGLNIGMGILKYIQFQRDKLMSIARESGRLEKKTLIIFSDNASNNKNYNLVRLLKIGLEQNFEEYFRFFNSIELNYLTCGHTFIHRVGR